MNLENSDVIFDLLSSSAFLYRDIKLNYSKIKENIWENKIGASCICYDLHMKLTNGSRELVVSLIKYNDFQMISVDIYNLKESSTRLSLDQYLINECNLKQVEKLIRFNSLNEKELAENLKAFFQWLDTAETKELSKILKGELWIDIPFDWHGYK